MLAICLREFKSLFKSIRSIFIIIIILGVTVGSAKMLSNFGNELQELGLEDAYMAGLFIILMLAGPLFVTSLSHDVINGETHSRTMRFLVTKISRDKIVIGKFLGVSLFWFVCILASLILVVPFANTFYFAEFAESFIFITYFVALSLFLSTVISKPGLSMFIGIVLSIAIPVLGTIGIVRDDLILIKIFSYITPYYYIGQEQTMYVYFIPILSLGFLLASVMILRKRDF